MPTAADWNKRLENARTFRRIPAAEWPNPLVRRALIERALAGHICFAYQPGGHGPWMIWDRPGAFAPQPPHRHGGFRYTLREWAIAHGYLAADAQAASHA